MAVTLQMSKTGIYFRVFKRLKKGVHMCSVAIATGPVIKMAHFPSKPEPDF